MQAPVVLAALLFMAGCLSCQAYYLQNTVWDAFAIEGTMNPNNPLVINIRNNYWSQSFSYLGENYVNKRVWTRIMFNPAIQRVYVGPSFEDNYGYTNWLPDLVREFSNLDFGWTTSGYVFYWKVQVEPQGYRIHFNDLERTNLISHQDIGNWNDGHCCSYPTNQYLQYIANDFAGAGAGDTLDFDRSWATYFTKNYPCVHPCRIQTLRGFFCCNTNTQAWGCQPYQGSAPFNDPGSTECGALTYQCAILGQPATLGGICEPPSYCTTNWCATELNDAGKCTIDAGGIYHHVDCAEDRRRRADTQLREEKKARLRPRATSRRSDPRSTNPQDRRSGTSRRSGTIKDRHKARHESFVFNYQYMHPMCWGQGGKQMEDIMYDNQNTAFFAPLFYWCYSASWCYSEEAACSQNKKIPRHVYDARINACLGVRGTMWTDLQIKQVLLGNLTDSADWFNISNGTIYSVAVVPPEEEPDDGLQFLSRLPLWGSLFSDPDCNITEGCHYPESLPDYFAHKYKNFEYLRDWVGGVNYEAYLQERRRTYKIPRTAFDYVKYCDHKQFSDICDKNALCYSRRKWPGYSCRCKDGYDGDGYFCAQANFKVTAEFVLDSRELDINATLRALSEEFSRRTGRPAEYFDVNPYLDTRAFETVGEDGIIKIVFVFGFENATELDGIFNASLNNSIGAVKIQNTTGDSSNGQAARLAKAGITGDESSAVKMTLPEPEDAADSESPQTTPDSEPSEAEGGGNSEDGQQGNEKDSALLLLAGGGVAGVAMLVSVGCLVIRRSTLDETEARASVVAVHGVHFSKHDTSISVASDFESESASQESAGTPAMPAAEAHKWRQNKTQEDSFKLAQDRSGIWTIDREVCEEEEEGHAGTPPVPVVAHKWKVTIETNQDSPPLQQDRLVAL